MQQNFNVKLSAAINLSQQNILTIWIKYLNYLHKNWIFKIKIDILGGQNESFNNILPIKKLN